MTKISWQLIGTFSYPCDHVVLFRSFDMAKLASTKVRNGPFSRFFKDKVSLSQEDISRTSDTINNFIPQILDKIRKEDDRFALRVLNTGNIIISFSRQPPALKQTNGQANEQRTVNFSLCDGYSLVFSIPRRSLGTTWEAKSMYNSSY